MLHVSEPDLSGSEERYVLEALRSTWISSSGDFVDRFEMDFALHCGRMRALSVCNGTAGLHLAMLGLGVRPGDEVIVPSMSFVATANAVRYVGATPIFVDIDPLTWCLDVDKAAEAITPRTRGIIAVHLYGHPAMMDSILDMASCHGLWVVEDAAEAHGAAIGSRPAGSFGRISVFSFYGNKIMSCGEGGAVLVDDEDLAKSLRLLRGQGMYPKPPNDRRYWHPMVGHNFRLTNIACAILCAQLERLPEMLGQRDSLAERYRQRIADLRNIQFRHDAPYVTVAPWVQPVVFADGETRDSAEAFLATHDVETRPFFYPLHKLPAYRTGQRLPVATDLAERGLCLPLHTRMTRDDVDRVCDLLGEIS